MSVPITSLNLYKPFPTLSDPPADPSKRKDKSESTSGSSNQNVGPNFDSSLVSSSLLARVLKLSLGAAAGAAAIFTVYKFTRFHSIDSSVSVNQDGKTLVVEPFDSKVSSLEPTKTMKMSTKTIELSNLKLNSDDSLNNNKIEIESGSKSLIKQLESSVRAVTEIATLIKHKFKEVLSIWGGNAFILGVETLLYKTWFNKVSKHPAPFSYERFGDPPTEMDPPPIERGGGGSGGPPFWSRFFIRCIPGVGEMKFSGGQSTGIVYSRWPSSSEKKHLKEELFYLSSFTDPELGLQTRLLSNIKKVKKRGNKEENLEKKIEELKKELKSAEISKDFNAEIKKEEELIELNKELGDERYDKDSIWVKNETMQLEDSIEQIGNKKKNLKDPFIEITERKKKALILEKDINSLNKEEVDIQASLDLIKLNEKKRKRNSSFVETPENEPENEPENKLDLIKEQAQFDQERLEMRKKINQLKREEIVLEQDYLMDPSKFSSDVENKKLEKKRQIYKAEQQGLKYTLLTRFLDRASNEIARLQEQNKEQLSSDILNIQVLDWKNWQQTLFSARKTFCPDCTDFSTYTICKK